MAKKLCFALATAASCAVAASAAQAQELTMRLGVPSTLDRVSVTEPVTLSCSGFDPSLTLFAEGVNMSVQQASGRSIAHGSASGFPPAIFPCDGSQNTFSVVVSADPSGPPFHGGAAVFTASAGVSAGTPCGNGCFFGPFENASTSVGPVSLKLN